MMVSCRTANSNEARITRNSTCVSLNLPLELACGICSPKLDVLTHSRKRRKNNNKCSERRQCQKYWLSKWREDSDGYVLRHAQTRKYLGIKEDSIIEFECAYSQNSPLSKIIDTTQTATISNEKKNSKKETTNVADNQLAIKSYETKGGTESESESTKEPVLEHFNFDKSRITNLSCTCKSQNIQICAYCCLQNKNNNEKQTNNNLHPISPATFASPTTFGTPATFATTHSTTTSQSSTTFQSPVMFAASQLTFQSPNTFATSESSQSLQSSSAIFQSQISEPPEDHKFDDLLLELLRDHYPKKSKKTVKEQKWDN